jgi:hypothetical protein
MKAAPGAAAEAHPHRLVWLVLIGLTVVASLAIYLQLAREIRLNGAHVASDFLVFWTAVKAQQPYDLVALSAAQLWYLEMEVLRPFAYPPSFLPWLYPFGSLGMISAYLLWTALTAALFLFAWSRFIGFRIPLLALAAPACAMAAIPGQMVFLLGALLVGGIGLIRRYPVAAGICLGVAATIKPQMLVLVPLALAAGGHWRTMLAAAVTGGAIGGVCLLLQGPALWLEWLRSAPKFMTVIREGGMIEFGITPASALARAGIEGPAAMLLRGVAGALGALAVWTVFRKSEDMLCRLLALIAGTLLLLPYAMPYELALAAPAATAMLLDRKLNPAAWLAAALMLTALAPATGLLMTAGVTVWLARSNKKLDPRFRGNDGAATSVS